jgi:alpha-beta hydrolase superfamily lysophospholipase
MTWTHTLPISSNSLKIWTWKDVIMVGHSTGGGILARFCGRHGTSRVKKAVLVPSVLPLVVKTKANPLGTPIEVFNSFHSAMLKDRSQFLSIYPPVHSSDSIVLGHMFLMVLFGHSGNKE